MIFSHARIATHFENTAPTPVSNISFIGNLDKFEICGNLRVPSHVSGMRCVFAQNHESERDALILLSLSLSWFLRKTMRVRETY